MSAKLNEMSQHSGLDMAKNPFPSESYSVVFADVNTGLNKKGSRGDEVAWSLPDFVGFFCKCQRCEQGRNVCGYCVSAP